MKWKLLARDEGLEKDNNKVMKDMCSGEKVTGFRSTGCIN